MYGDGFFSEWGEEGLSRYAAETVGASSHGAIQSDIWYFLISHPTKIGEMLTAFGEKVE